MKLCTFEVSTRVGRQRRLGAVTAAGVVDLNFACARLLSDRVEPRPRKLASVVLPDNMLEFLEAGPAGARYAAETLEAVARGPGEGIDGETILYDRGEVRLLAPVPEPPSLRDFFAFEEHVKAGFERRGEPMPREWYELPVYYKGGHQNIVGTDQDVLWPSFTERFDYELELAIVIGKEGRDIPAERAHEYIAGYTVMNDFSARDMQRREMKVRLGPAKGKDWATALGPWLVTPDEAGDPYNLRMAARVNGELWSEGNSASMYWKFEQMIEFLTRDDAVHPGDVIGSGTVGGGCGLELDRWVKPGDVIELEIENIGILRNRVVRKSS
jgi:2-keto-4-pentenoate hydratase/2-oxohepta-3-ene-1,7-dioic acid hydratase in catechol pathway